MQKIIDIVNGVARHPLYRLAQPVNFTACDGECLAIVGNNAAGKSMLIDIITGKHPLLMNPVKYDFAPSKAKMVYDNLKHITFHDSYGTDDGTYYYQQRWNQHDIDDYPTVRELLQQAEDNARKSLDDELALTDEEKLKVREQRNELKLHVSSLFHIDQLLDKKIVMLSSGELRKFQLTRALLSNPRVLILDNPFIGLDVNARQQLHDLMRVLVTQTKLMLLVVLSKTDDMPDFITHVVEVRDRVVMPKITLLQWKLLDHRPPEHVLSEENAQSILNLPYSDEFNLPEDHKADEVIKFDNVCIRYGERTILKDLSFTVRNGEHWALSGENGSGKSTLLSIVCADNPQAYANSITLFGYKRGTGESIWDIKRYIGYISPEMHRAYLRDFPAIEIVASGLRDSVGLYLKPKPEQMDICRFWMDIFGIGQHDKTTFLKLSAGEQRLVLLARAFVKDPALLILDEPLHGLDLHNRRLVKDVIETFCKRKNKTLIMVTHYKEELPNNIDHSIFLKKQN